VADRFALSLGSRRSTPVRLVILVQKLTIWRQESPTLGVMRHITELSYCEVTLLDGQTVEAWGDGYQELDGAYVFSVLA
jgi:hypothetical protein